MYGTEILRGLRPHDLEALARAHDGVAESLRRAAIERAGDLARSERARRLIENLAQLPDAAARLARHAGVAPCAAAQQIGAETGVPAETVAHYMKRRTDELRRLARGRRDREVMRLARLGWSNAEIGRKLALHPSSVSRIVQKALRDS